MKNAIITILKKELLRFFSDKRMAITTILLPGVMIYVMYSFMGSALSEKFTVDDKHVYNIESKGALPESINALINNSDVGFDVSDTSDDIDKVVDRLKDEKIDLYVIFPENFDKEVEEYNSNSGSSAPEVKVYYNSASTESDSAYSVMTELLNTYESALSNKFDINADIDTEYDVADDKDVMATVFSSMLPMLLLMFMFSACMSIGPDSIAGEKERGTIATLLVTPTKRGNIALGKIIALSIIALLSGVSSTLGTMLSLPKLMATEGKDISADIYTIMDYVMLAVIILTTTMLIVAIISIVSAFAKSTKEAQTYLTPLMIVVMIVGISGMFSNGAQTDIVYYLIPIYNSVQSMLGVFTFEIVPLNMIISVISNVIYTGVCVFILTRMFNSEKIMFNR